MGKHTPPCTDAHPSQNNLLPEKNEDIEVTAMVTGNARQSLIITGNHATVTLVVTFTTDNGNIVQTQRP